MILVTGAGGVMGRKLVCDLAARGAEVRAFVKSPAQAKLAEADGATDVFVGDIRRPTDVERSLHGVRQVFHAAPTSVIRELPIAEAIVKAGRANGLEHVVFHSVIHPGIEELFHHQEKGRVEQLLAASGVPTTSLRSSLIRVRLFTMVTGTRPTSSRQKS